MRVLVVEDFEVLARSIGTGLRREGMAVDVVLDGTDALSHLATTRYDVIVLDRDLPGVHGDDICRRLVADGADSRVLMLTASSTVKDRVDGLGLGADDYLPGRLPHRRLTMSIRTTLAKRLRRATLREQLTALYAGLLVVVVAVVLVAAAVLFRTATAPPGAGIANGHSRWFEIGAGIVIVLAVLVGLWFAWQLAGLYLRPLRTLNATARDIAATNLHRRLGLQGPDDEITQLGSTLDELFGRLESSFESQRRFVANASHELRTPLAGQRTLLQVALADPDASTKSLRAACEEALALGERQRQLVDGLLTLASSERGIERRELLDLAEIADRVLVSRHQAAARRGIEIRAALDPAPTTGDPILIESLVANLLDNAIQHNVPDGSIELTTGQVKSASQLSVGNSGPIVPAGDVERLFLPFQRLGHARTGFGNGHGLGLAIVQAIAQAHHANITPHPRSAGGLDIEVNFASPKNSITAT